MIIGIQMDNGLSSFVEIDEVLLDVSINPLEMVTIQLMPHLNEVIQRRNEQAPGEES